MVRYGCILISLIISLMSHASVKNVNDNPVIIADTINKSLSLAPIQSLVQGEDTSNEIVVSHAGAAFIKVHFEYFNLPDGAYVVVSDPLGNESYTYDGIAHDSATFSGNDGENGLNQFSAMSIFGDTAIVKLIMPPDANWQSKHGIKIDRINAGFTTAINPIDKTNVAAPESTCGVNERKDVACWVTSHPVEYERTRPVARLLMSGSGLCTGWRVGSENYMFTNNHCVETQSELSNTEVWFNYQNTTCGGSTKAGTVKVTGKDLFKTDYDLDYTLFSVNNFDTIESFGNFGIETRLPTLGELIYIAQHGSGNPKELAIESDQNTNGHCQIDIATTNGRGTNTDTGYFCDTIGGSSGSPVIASSSNKVIALHHFGGCENQGVQMYKIWPQVSSYFGGTPPNGDGGSGNQNIPPSAQASINCSGLVCSFDGSSSQDTDGTITSYQWNFGDGSSSTGINANHSYAASGTYNVSLTVTDNEGATNVDSQSISVSDGSSSNELQSGVPVANLAGSKDEILNFYINATEANSIVEINIDGGTGDADLYARLGTEPSKSDYDCRPYKNGNTESCTLTVNNPDTVFVSLIGYTDFSGVTLTANVTVGNDNGFPKANLTANKGDWLRFTYVVPANQSQITVNMSGGTGDSDLYVKKTVQPTKNDWDCRPYKLGNNETCTLNVVVGEEIHIGLHAYSDFSGVLLNVE
ncbi:PKD domain-containing protein [Thalassotalea fusca]